jgi:alcohol dehydrogenase class IV
MQSIGLPNGLKAVGYTADDIPALTEGTLKQKRLLAVSPEAVTQKAVERILEESIVVW